MTTHIHTEADLEPASRRSIALDPRWAPVSSAPGGRRCGAARADSRGWRRSSWRSRSRSRAPPRSTAASSRSRDPFDHASVLRARKDKLLRVGLSNAKVKTLKEIAKAIEAKHIDLARARRHAGRRRACGAGRAARHRPVDRRHLSARLHRPCGRVAGRRSRAAGSRAHRLRSAASGRPPRRWARSPNAGGPIARWRRGCCGPTIAS